MHEQSPAGPAALEPGDYYYDGPYLVFTAQYHLKRGTCCNSSCRHCPYLTDEAPVQKGAPAAPGGES